MMHYQPQYSHIVKTIRELLFLTEGPDDRISYLVKKFRGSPLDAFLRDWAEVKSTLPHESGFNRTAADILFPNLQKPPTNLDMALVGFVSRIVNEIDPTQGKYADWIVTTFSKMDGAVKRRWLLQFDEDFPKIKNALILYHKFRPKLKGMGNDVVVKLPGLDYVKANQLTDINRASKYAVLLSLSQQIFEPLEAEDDTALSAGEAVRIYESPAWLIIQPKTERASCKYGAGTQWCTAARTNNYFDRYNKRGPLYIVINRATQEKWQLHFESEQFMDANDEPFNIASWISSNPELSPVLYDLAAQRSLWGVMAAADVNRAAGVAKKIEIDSPEHKNLLISADAVAAIGAVEPDLMNSLQRSFVFGGEGGTVDWHTDRTWYDLIPEFSHDNGDLDVLDPNSRALRFDPNGTDPLWNSWGMWLFDKSVDDLARRLIKLGLIPKGGDHAYTSEIKQSLITHSGEEAYNRLEALAEQAMRMVDLKGCFDTVLKKARKVVLEIFDATDITPGDGNDWDVPVVMRLPSKSLDTMVGIANNYNPAPPSILVPHLFTTTIAHAYRERGLTTSSALWARNTPEMGILAGFPNGRDFKEAFNDSFCELLHVYYPV